MKNTKTKVLPKQDKYEVIMIVYSSENPNQWIDSVVNDYLEKHDGRKDCIIASNANLDFEGDEVATRPAVEASIARDESDDELIDEEEN